MIHEMMYIGETADGYDRYICPDCGRTVLLRWPPDFHKVVEVEGDISAVHTGGSTSILAQLAIDIAPNLSQLDMANVPERLSFEDNQEIVDYLDKLGDSLNAGR